jgi:cell division protein FtsB
VPYVPHFAPAAAAAGDTGTLALVDEINRLRSENAQLQTSNTQLRQETAQLHDRLRMAQQLAGQYLTELNVARHQVSAPNKRQR